MKKTVNYGRLLVMIQELLTIRDCRYGSGYSGNYIPCIDKKHGIRLAVSYDGGITDLETAAWMQHEGNPEIENSYLIFDTDTCPGLWTHHHEVMKRVVLGLAEDSKVSMIRRDQPDLNIVYYNHPKSNIMVRFRNSVNWEMEINLRAAAKAQTYYENFQFISASIEGKEVNLK